MGEAEKLPEVVVFSGPNGSGKSTVTQLLRPRGMDYINADDIKRVLGCSDLEAAQLAEQKREEHLARHAPFCFETVMSTERNLHLLQRARTAGFFVRAYIVLTADSDINVARVRGRVLAGGHDVPEEKIHSRYKRSLALVREVVKAADVCNIYDNTFAYPMRFFNQKKAARFYEAVPFWDLRAIQELTGCSDLAPRDLNAQNPFVAQVLQETIL